MNRAELLAKGLNKSSTCRHVPFDSRLQMMENTAMNYIVSLTQRLATNIPTASKELSYTDLLSDLYSNSTKSQSLYDLLILTIIVVLALELVSNAVYHVPKSFVKSIPVRGKHLDHFSIKDWAFIGFNKALTGIFVYLYFGYLWSVRHKGCGSCCGGKGIWKLEDLTIVSHSNATGSSFFYSCTLGSVF